MRLASISARIVKLSLTLSLSLSLALAALAAARGSALAADDDPWPGIRAELFGERAVTEGDTLLTLYAPETAENAALVPVSVRLDAARAGTVRKLYLIVDRNPAPVAATITLGQGFAASSTLGERMLETRLRIDSFAKVRAVAETADGRLFMAAKFVAGSGGCSGNGPPDLEAAIAGLGAMQVIARADSDRGESWREGVLKIRHPNLTGMQKDLRSGSYTPARFVDDIEVTRGGSLLFRVEGGISISENPHFRFNFDAGDNDAIVVKARDTSGARFEGRSTPAGS